METSAIDNICLCLCGRGGTILIIVTITMSMATNNYGAKVSSQVKPRTKQSVGGAIQMNVHLLHASVIKFSYNYFCCLRVGNWAAHFKHITAGQCKAHIDIAPILCFPPILTLGGGGGTQYWCNM